MQYPTAIGIATYVLTCIGANGVASKSIDVTTTAPSNTNLKSLNPTPTVVDINDFPTTGLNYATTYFAAGHFGSTSAECYIQQTQERNSGNSSLSLADAPAYVYCTQVDGTVKEVSAQLFGQKFNIQGEYPLIADLNGDGMDDIFLLRQCDCAESVTEAHVFISKPDGTYTHTQIAVTPVVDGGNTMSLGAGTQFSAMDISRHGNGCKDVVGPLQYAFVNDCSGHLTQLKYADPTFVLNGYQYATGSCAADFAGLGHDQLVLTDRMVPDANLATNAIVDFDANRNVTSKFILPIPFLAGVYNQQNGSHDYMCKVADVNNDGKPDLFIYTWNWYVHQATPSIPLTVQIQVYLNTSTGGVVSFDDKSTSAFPGMNLTAAPSYSPRFVDLNGDGYLDMVLEGQTYSGSANSGNQIWINNQNNTFHQVFGSELNTLYASFAAQFGGAMANEVDSMLPIKANGKWDYLIQLRDHSELHHMGVANTQFVFR